jgi:hypothetical protein
MFILITVMLGIVVLLALGAATCSITARWLMMEHNIKQLQERNHPACPVSDDDEELVRL